MIGEVQKEGVLSTRKQIILELFRDSFDKVKEEFDEHREAINENTNEIQANYEFLCDLDKKIGLLNEKMNMIIDVLKKENKIEEVKPFKIKPLSKREKIVFTELYRLCAENCNMVMYKELAIALKMSESLVSNYITNFIAKGVPVTKKYSDNKVILGLDPRFRDIQAKNNVVGVNTLLSYWMH